MTPRNPDVIRSEIERTREEIARSLLSLKSSVIEASDWKSYVRRNPLAFVGGAFALGLFIGWR